MYNFSFETHFDQNGVLNSTDKKASQPYLSNRETLIPKCLLNFGSNLIKSYKLAYTSILQFITNQCLLSTYSQLQLQPKLYKQFCYSFSLKTRFNQNGVLNSTDNEVSQPYLRNREADFQEASLYLKFWDKSIEIRHFVLE